MKKKAFAVLQTLVDFIFPRNCLGCESFLKFYEKHLCISCQIKMPLTSFHLIRENPLYEKINVQFESTAVTSLFFFQKEGAIAHMIHLFKYKGERKIRVFLGEWLANTLQESAFFKDIDGIVPVPLHPKKQKKRGYNQAEIVGATLSKKMGVPLYTEVLERIKNTTALALLGESARKNEVTNAFIQQQPFPTAPQHVLLIDDVLTTGATLAACASVLLKNSGLKISIAVLACRL